MRMMNWVVVIVVLTAAVCAGPVRGVGIVDVWAVNDGEKIKRDDLKNPNRRENSVWDGRRVSIFGARNEVVAFQLILQAGKTDARNVDVVLPKLVRRGGKGELVWKPEIADPSDTRATTATACWFIPVVT